MGRKRQNSSGKEMSDSRHLLRRSPRFNPLAKPPQPSLGALSHSREFPRRSPRFNPLARPLQPPLRRNKQMKSQGAQITTLKQKLVKTKNNEKTISSSKNPEFNILSLPEELITKILGYISQNQLGEVARVCRKFNECTRCAVLWKRVDVTFSWYMGSQNEIVSIFIKKLPSSVRYMKLDFAFYTWNWKNEFNFEQFCVSLKEKCQHLHTLILRYAILSDSLPSMVGLCSEFFPNLKSLILSESVFGRDCKIREYDGVPKIEILAVSQCGINGSPSSTFPKVPYLKKLNFFRTCVSDYWFLNNDDVFPLHQLKTLHLGITNISYKVFRLLKSHAVNLTELSLCHSKIIDADFTFNKPMFPLLKTICLRCCPFVTCEGVVTLVRSCQALQDIYVNRDVAETYANHAFVADNISKLGIVKVMDNCDHFSEADCLSD